MRRLDVFLLVALPLALMSCAKQSSTQSTQTADTTAQTPDTTTSLHGVALVAQLPAGAEGLELADGGLRLKKGYQFVKESDSTFAIARMNDGRHVAAGGCGCHMGVGCFSILTTDGIIVCNGLFTCIRCGLALTSNDVRTEVFAYERAQQQQ